MLQLQGELSLETGDMSDDVADLVEHVWQEAVGELNAILAVPIESINMDQVVCLCDQYLRNTCVTTEIR